jgi:glycosyltransferase involved in cell wall biosynthesis
MKNVGIDGQIFAWQTVGGVSRYFSNLLTMDVSAGGDDVAIYPYFTRHRNAYLQAASIGLYCPGNTLEEILLRDLHLLADGSEALYPIPSIIHSTYYAGLPWNSNKNIKAKLVTSLFDMIPECFPGFFPGGSPHLQKMEWFDASDLIISISDSASADLLDIRPQLADRVRTIHLANALTRVDLCTSPTASKLRPYFLFIGTRSAYKNWIQALKGLSRSLSVLKEHIIVFAGGGAPNDVEQKLIQQLGLSERVQFLSPNDQQLAYLYEGASAVLVPSLSEGFSLPLVEGLAMDVPVLCSDITVHREVGQDYCTFLSPTNTQEWADAMAAVDTFQPPSAILGDMYISKVQYFSYPRVVDAHKAIYAAL